jgi:ribose-phosphate pyrophosphokinase
VTGAHDARAVGEARLFALGGSRELGERVAHQLGVALAHHEERDFEDGEHKSRPLVSVRRRDAIVISSLAGDERRSVDDRLCRLLFFLAALRDAGASSVVAVTPYLCYARKDRRSQPRDPVTSRYVATFLEAAGVDRVLACDVHNDAAYQNAFRCGADHLEARGLFVAHLAERLAGERLAVVSPDAGGVKRADRLRRRLADATGEDVASAVVEKRRALGVVTGGALAGDVEGRVAIVVDDLVSTGGTLVRAARACLASGATRVIAVATHAVFSPGASDVLADEALSELVVTDTVPPGRLGPGPALAKLTVLGIAPLLAEAIARLLEGGSLVELVGP